MEHNALSVTIRCSENGEDLFETNSSDAVRVPGGGRIVDRAILRAVPDAPVSLLRSMGADLFTLRDPRDTHLIDGSIMEGSPLVVRDRVNFCQARIFVVRF